MNRRTPRRIEKAAVLGAGTMGAGIAAHLANAGIPVLLLDIAPSKLEEGEETAGLSLDHPKVKNRIVAAGWRRLLKSKPPQLMSKGAASLVSLGNFDDDWDALAEVDWIVEVVVERLDIKQKVFARVDEVRKETCVVSSNTSGLAVSGLVEGRSEGFKEHFLVTHFFNPVRYMRLLELVPGVETSDEVYQEMADFGRFRLGKGIVHGSDTPNFVGNRIGVFGICSTVWAMLEMDYQVDEVDTFTGKALGRPKSASFGTIDLVGLDVLAHVIGTLREGCPDDEQKARFEQPELVTKMIEMGAVGRKVGAGFFKLDRSGGTKTKMVLDWKTGEYRVAEKPKYDSLKAARIADPAARIKAYLSVDDRASQFAWRVLSESLAYASMRIGEIADSLVDVDNAMKWGFNWELGPFEIWDALGVAETVARMKASGVEPAAWVEEMLANGESFYKKDGATVTVYEPSSKSWVALARPSSFIVLPDLKRGGARVGGTDGASIVDIGDGICCLEFHSQLQPEMNPLDESIIEAMMQAIDLAEREFDGMVVHHQGVQFSAGANLMMILGAIQKKDWDGIEAATKAFQDATFGLRNARIPVVTAPFGLTLGGGAELTMGADATIALAETYMGLVEFGVGVIPAGGGCLYMLERAVPTYRETTLDNLPALKSIFMTVGMARVSGSAEEAKELGYLRPSDRIEMNRDQQLASAKTMARSMADLGYQPPRPRSFSLLGSDGAATLGMMLRNLQVTNQISAHDELIGNKLAWIIAGGDTRTHTPVSSERILELEREAFVSLCGEEKTAQRIEHMLKTGKPLRN